MDSTGRKQKMARTLEFNEEKHVYTVEGKELQSVTQWVSSFFPPFDLKGVSKFVAKRARARGETNAKGKPVTAWDIRREWAAIRDRGTEIHKQIEDVLNGETDKSMVSVPAQHGLTMVREEVNKLSMKAPEVRPEWRVFSEELGLAGTLDCPIVYGDRVTILDFKCVKNLTADKIKKYTLQLSAYAYILEKEYGLTVDKMYLLQLLDKDSKRVLVEYQRDKIEEMIENGKRD